MLFLQETNSILFLGSPSVEKLEELIGKGIYISDIPIHDATRDVILVGEQTKAQVCTSDSCLCLSACLSFFLSFCLCFYVPFRHLY